jgi:hypothetical protein
MPEVLCDLRFWSPRRDSNPRPSDYESKSLRPADAAQTRSGCSRQWGRLLSSFLTCRVMAGGMTKGMTSLAMAGQPAVLLPSDLVSEGVAPTGKPTFRRRSLMVGPAPSDTESDGKASSPRSTTSLLGLIQSSQTFCLVMATGLISGSTAAGTGGPGERPGPHHRPVPRPGATIDQPRPRLPRGGRRLLAGWPWPRSEADGNLARGPGDKEEGGRAGIGRSRHRKLEYRLL